MARKNGSSLPLFQNLDQGLRFHEEVYDEPLADLIRIHPVEVRRRLVAEWKRLTGETVLDRKALERQLNRIFNRMMEAHDPEAVAAIREECRADLERGRMHLPKLYGARNREVTKQIRAMKARPATRH